MSELDFTWKLDRLNRFIGLLLWKLKRTPSATTSIADTLEIGYGPEFDGFFKYPAPKEAYPPRARMERTFSKYIRNRLGLRGKDK